MRLLTGLTTSWGFFQQHRGRNIQGLRDLFQNEDRWIADAAFETADVSSMYPALEGKIFLRASGFLTQSPEVLTDTATYIHVPRWTVMQSNDLQTMSLIFAPPHFRKCGAFVCSTRDAGHLKSVA